ncbi:unnamed protein product [Medioppia subpectinata]|uniref:Ubiquitin carboxyl-terminal hydrolase n=1 Tax=Medioppia subpectinata TaxID=1979941 RepID=A0A7R9Q932_9ACAR|nr:unnamed protein product [Medioppia subpectinata]CAG2115958.1 unnamed protein product [Medioppia subpectinata]
MNVYHFSAFNDTLDPIHHKSVGAVVTDSNDNEGEDSRVGLDNLGNTCYLNAVVQCLANTDSLRHYFTSYDFEDDLNRSKGLIAYPLARLIRQLWTPSSDGVKRSVRPTHVRSLCDRWSSLSWGQNDAHEFCTFLLDSLHNDLNRSRLKPSAITSSAEADDDNNNSTDVHALANSSWNEFKRFNDSIVVDLFYGQYMSAIVCSVCPKRSLKFDPFVYLSLPIPLTHKDINLRDCLDLYSAPEVLSQQNSWHCPQCRTSREATKYSRFWRLPRILIIQLNRFCFDIKSCPEKITSFVDFPLHNLDLSSYSLSGQLSSYDLYAVVNHYGDVNGGHYKAYAKDTNIFKGLGWRCFDDNHVDDMRPDSVITRNAYILFYKRKDYNSHL